MATVTAFLQHTPIGKSTQAEPYTAASHARYITRRSAASLIYSERMPKQYHALQRFLNQHEDGLRRNGRVLDKFIISIPHDVSEADAVTALKRFGYRLGKGKTPFLFALHGFDTRNHHAHFIFIDRSIEDGKRVFGTSERGSSAGIKLEWETAANDTFAELGYDVRVQVKEGYEQANDNQPLEAEPDIDTVTEPVAEDAPEGEDTVAQADRFAVDDRAEYHGTDFGYHVKYIYQWTTELNRLRDSQARLQEAEQALARATQNRERAKLAASQHFSEVVSIRHQNLAQAEHALSSYQNDTGDLKGRSFKLFKWEIKTPTRKAAEKVAERVSIASTSLEIARNSQREYEHDAQVAEAAEQRAEREAYMRRNELEDLYGSMEEVAETEADLQNTIRGHLNDIEALNIPIPEALEAVVNDEVTLEELRTYLVASGQTDLLAVYEETFEKDKGPDMTD